MCYNRIMSTEHSTTNSGQRAAQTREKIVDRVRKLLNLAANDAAAEGEIRNAMKAASRLIAEYQIEQTELEASGESADPTYKQGFQSYGVSRPASWMGTLAMAVAKAVGSVGVYRTSRSVRKGAFGREASEAGVEFYGIDADVDLARDVLNEWLIVIATMVAGKYGGGGFQGDGLAYARGFANALYNIAADIYKDKALPPCTDPQQSTSIVPVVAALAKKRAEADAWLKEQGIRLGKVRSTSYSTASSAYSQGYADGRRSGFGVSRTKALGGRR